MASARFDCAEVSPGISESSEFTMGSDNQINLAFEADKCVSAWLEYSITSGDSTLIGKFKVLPFNRTMDTNNKLMLPNGAKFKVVASVGRGGYFKGFVYY